MIDFLKYHVCRVLVIPPESTEQRRMPSPALFDSDLQQIPRFNFSTSYCSSILRIAQHFPQFPSDNHFQSLRPVQMTSMKSFEVVQTLIGGLSA